MKIVPELKAHAMQTHGKWK